MKELLKIVETSGLEKSESQTIIDRFGNYEDIAKEWEAKAKAIIVTSEDQTTEMAMAREARKKFSDLRIELEKSRKAMKEQSLRKGQAIDAVAKYLQSLISPIEEHLRLQEDFIKIKEAEKAEQIRLEAEKKAEAERMAQEEAERKEQERIRLENIKLQKEAIAREAKMAEEQKLAEDKLRAEQEANEKIQADIRAKAEAERIKSEELVRLEKEKADKIIADERAKAENERLEKEKVQKLLDEQVECPFCHKKFNLDK